MPQDECSPNGRVFGFPKESKVFFSFDNYEKKFVLKSKKEHWFYIRNNKKIKIKGERSCKIKSNGLWFLFIDNDEGTIDYSKDSWTLDQNDNKVYIAIVEIQDSLIPNCLIYNELHPGEITRQIHYMIHNDRGAICKNKIELFADENKKISISSGTLVDEDLSTYIPSHNKGDLFLLRYNINNNWLWQISRSPYIDTLKFNKNAKTLEKIENNFYANSYVVISAGGYQIVIGQDQFESINKAIEEKIILPPAFIEFVLLYRLIWKAEENKLSLIEINQLQ